MPTPVAVPLLTIVVMGPFACRPPLIGDSGFLADASSRAIPSGLSLGGPWILNQDSVVSHPKSLDLLLWPGPKDLYGNGNLIIPPSGLACGMSATPR